ncbi:MAG: hypothetical protein GWP10_06885, partial [Nitrospiraceae bacterium]|nr:hypothetical protein [Nitrospiraceae bacterium]
IGVDVDIFNANHRLVAEIRNDKITIRDKEKYQLQKIVGRSSVIENESGRILYDFQSLSEGSEVDFKLSLITHIVRGIPVFLHPNRIRIGSSHIEKPHITSLKISTKKGMEGPALIISLSPKDGEKQYLHVPRAPMIGPGGVVANLLTTKTSQIKPGMSVLMMSGKDNRAANISFQGPCYFLDVAFEDFKTAIAINSALSDNSV